MEKFPYIMKLKSEKKLDLKMRKKVTADKTRIKDSVFTTCWQLCMAFHYLRLTMDEGNIFTGLLFHALVIYIIKHELCDYFVISTNPV